MAAIAPNLTVLVGELVGARLIAHAGSLMSLAKYPVRWQGIGTEQFIKKNPILIFKKISIYEILFP